MEIQQYISLADKNWFKTGGKAHYYCRPTNEQEFAHAVQFANQEGIEIFVLGEGANILLSDEGFSGLVIHPQLTDMMVDSTRTVVTAGAGVRVQDLIDYCLEQHCLGIEEFSGIPGTVGGSVYINIHYFQFLLSQFLVNARVIDRATGTIYDVDQSWFNFGYDYSKLFEKQHYVVQASFAVKPVDAVQAAYAKGRRDEIIRHRLNRYPRSNTCGSFFRNFLPDELSFEIEGKKVPFVAYYLDKIGVKGVLRVGNAVVSYQHANMLVTQDNATTADVIALARTLQTMVREKFGITPQAECQFIGFSSHPLLEQL